MISSTINKAIKISLYYKIPKNNKVLILKKIINKIPRNKKITLLVFLNYRMINR